ncbi:MAG: BA14K family protein [Parvibaculaceae bacterium]
MRYKPLALAVAALVAGLVGFGGAEAANVLTGSGAPAQMTQQPDANIQQINHRHWRRNGYGRYGYGGFGSGLFLGFGLGSFYRPYGYGYPYYGYGYGYRPYYNPYYGSYYRPSYPSYYGGGGSRHVRWCYNRYRTYSARTNPFRGYDGYRHRCRSPYRY